MIGLGDPSVGRGLNLLRMSACSMLRITAIQSELRCHRNKNLLGNIPDPVWKDLRIVVWGGPGPRPPEGGCSHLTRWGKQTGKTSHPEIMRADWELMYMEFLSFLFLIYKGKNVWGLWAKWTKLTQLQKFHPASRDHNYITVQYNQWIKF